MPLILKETRRAIVILKGVQENQLKQATNEYLKPIEHKVWHDVVQEQIVTMTLELDKFFKQQANKLYQLIHEEEQLFIPKKKNEESVAITKVLQAIDLITKADEPKRYKVWQYLDRFYNRVVVKDIKDKIIEYFKSFNKELEKIYYKNISATYEKVSQSISTDETPFEFNKSNKWVKKRLQDKVIKWSKQVTKTTEERIKRTLLKGYKSGASIFDIANSIKKNEGFSFSRAEKIARTEIFSAGNYIDYLSFNQNSDVIGYKWRSMGDGRVRPTHARANGQFRKKGKPFNIGGSRLLYPGDNSLGAAAKEVICCRCYLDPIFADEVGLGSGGSDKYHDSNDEVKSLGYLNIEDQEGIEQFLEMCENRIKEQPIEYAFIITTAGEALQVKGTTGQVHIEKVGAEKLKGAIVTHNHPNIYEDGKLVELGGSFSDDDILMYMIYGIGELRAVDGEYRYTLKAEKITLDQINKLLSEIEIEILNSTNYYSDVEKKHLIIKMLMQKNNNIKYKRVKIDE